MESNVSKAGPEQVNASENGAASTHPTQTHRHEGSGALAPRNEDGGDGVRAGDGQRDVGRRVAIWWQYVFAATIRGGETGEQLRRAQSKQLTTGGTHTDENGKSEGNKRGIGDNPRVGRVVRSVRRVGSGRPKRDDPN
jgi:hypothetical protein